MGTPSKIALYDLYYSQKMFGAFVRRVKHKNICESHSAMTIYNKIQNGGHQGLIPLGTPSKIDHYDILYSQTKFDAFVRRVNIKLVFLP